MFTYLQQQQQQRVFFYVWKNSCKAIGGDWLTVPTKIVRHKATTAGYVGVSNIQAIGLKSSKLYTQVASPLLKSLIH